MASAVSDANVVVYPDGRQELRDASEVQDSPLYNGDLAPVPVARRTWTTYNYCALWIGMAHNIPTYLLASSLILLGMAWYQAVITRLSRPSGLPSTWSCGGSFDGSKKMCQHPGPSGVWICVVSFRHSPSGMGPGFWFCRGGTT